MKELYRKYLEWLRAALWNTPPTAPMPAGDEWTQWIDLSRRQSTEAMIYTRMLEQGEQIPESVKQQMQIVCVQVIRDQVRLQHTLQTVWSVLNDAGIQPVLFKGISLAMLYPSPSMRQWGDIDLYVGKAQFHAACRVMREAFPNAKEEGEESERVKHYVFIIDGIGIEIHRRAVTLPGVMVNGERLMVSGERLMVSGNDLQIRIPGVDFNTLFVFMHSWEHTLWRGTNAKHLSDLTLMLHHHAGSINRQWLISNLRTLHLLDIWKLYMYILVHYFGLPEDEAPCYTPRCRERAERFLIDTLDGVISRQQSAVSSQRVPRCVLARKIYTLRQRMRKPRCIAQYSPSFARRMRWQIVLQGILKQLLSAR